MADRQRCKALAAVAWSVASGAELTPLQAAEFAIGSSSSRVPDGLVDLLIRRNSARVVQDFVSDARVRHVPILRDSLINFCIVPLTFVITSAVWPRQYLGVSAAAVTPSKVDKTKRHTFSRAQLFWQITLREHKADAQKGEVGLVR
jgi:hypothetical protein